jgi:hypothetical protein
VSRPNRTRTDDGSTLVIVLLIVTAFALVTTVVLSQLDTNMRSTIALRDQVGTTYDADAAAQVAISQLVTDNFNGTPGACNLTDVNLSLPAPFYPTTNGVRGSDPSSAYVTCTHDSSNSAGGGATLPNNSPGNAILALDNNLTEVGIYSNVNAGAVKVRGAVFSNSAISAPGGLVNVWARPAGSTASTYNIARGACTPVTNRNNKGVWVENSAYGATTCDYSASNTHGQDPYTLIPHGASYDLPSAPSGNAVISPCAAGDKFQKVTAGRFSGAAALSALNGLSGCANGVVWFQPGTYYFDLPGMWNVPSVYLVGGTFDPTYAKVTTDPATWADVTKACVVPGGSGATTSSGVNFVVGGASQLGVNNSANPGTHMTICASNSVSGPPIAIYGLRSALGGSFPVAAEASCTPSGSGFTSCSVISTGNSPKSTLTVQGTTYVPKGVIDVTLNNNTKKIFYWGLISWAVEFSGTGSADVANAIVDVPDTAPDPTPVSQTVYLTVYVCIGASSCNTTGTVQLKARVKFEAGTRAATVLSWSQQN